MKRTILLILIAAAFAGCTAPEATTPWLSTEPTFANTQPASVTALEPVARLMQSDGESPFPSGAGIWPVGDYVFGSALSNRFFVADISDPEAPVLVFQAPEDSVTEYGRDADVVLHPDGRASLVIATQWDGLHVWDITHPTAPEFLARVPVSPNHNVAVIPGTTFVFNSQSGGEGRSNELLDLTDPLFPQIAGTYGTHGCHDVAFHGTMGDDKFRAYCAGIERTEIWDLSGFDPAAADFGITLVATVEGAQSPVVGSPLFEAYPLRTLHHLAMVNEDASVLIIGDEHNGGGSPGTCLAYEPTTGLSTPLGALWFYDISNEASPQLLSWISPPTEQPAPDTEPDTDRPERNSGQTPNCTAHFGSVVPGEEKLVMAWYSAGVLLIDFSDPASPRILYEYDPEPEAINTWDARIHNGYVFTGDIVRGMEVLKLV